MIGTALLGLVQAVVDVVNPLLLVVAGVLNGITL